MAQPGEEREASCQRPPAGMLLPFPLSSSNPVLLHRLEFGGGKALPQISQEVRKHGACYLLGSGEGCP